VPTTCSERAVRSPRPQERSPLPGEATTHHGPRAARREEPREGDGTVASRRPPGAK
jgi:hypothetical protein